MYVILRMVVVPLLDNVNSDDVMLLWVQYVSAIYLHICTFPNVVYCNYILTVVSYGVLCANSCELSRIEFAHYCL